MSIDLSHVARDLGLPAEQVQRTLELLEEGNTVPFITRFRKDQIGGLDEEQVRRIQDAAAKQRQLEDRKQTILKSVESQGKLTDDLAERIRAARSIKHLEDLYLPFKQKKQTLATLARQRGLEPLAEEILAGTATDLNARATEFISPDNGLPSVDEVLASVGNLLAEKFSERADLRSRLRRVMQRTGKIVTTRIESEKKSEPTAAANSNAETVTPSESAEHEELDESLESMLAQQETDDQHESGEQETTEPETTEPDSSDSEHADALSEPASEVEQTDGEASTSSDTDASAAVVASESEPGAGSTANSTAAPLRTVVVARMSAKQQARAAAREAKKKKRQKLLESAFKDYYNFQEPVGKIPHHRILAINRGERARVLRVKIDVDLDAIAREADELIVTQGHPHSEFLRGCLKDALSRLIVPSLERELRRELTEKAETHAVEVFIQNLRKLLLQPPVRGHKVLAIDPGFRSGCKLTAIDQFGTVLDHGMIHVIGSEQHRQLCRTRLVEMIKKHGITVVAIGNGTACRETETLIADLLANELSSSDVAYVIVNEAGASVYSTSPIGREELPKYDVTVRSAVSIGRRLLDPLSELVKINPANIGVGLYQHDVKAKHLRDSLDAVVESCVNFVGVDVNTASPALLRYVSGLNQLTARRLYEYRLQHGPFKNREQFKQVPGFGDATFVQAAGFLKIIGGDNPLDATWIHPESYAVAKRVLEKLGASVEELVPNLPTPPPVEASTPVLSQTEMNFEAVSATEAIPAETSTELDSPTVPVADPTEAAASTDSIPGDSPVADGSAQDPLATSTATSPPPSDATTVRETLATRIAEVRPEELAAELGIGQLLLEDMLASLARPARDPREDLPAPVFRRGIMKLEDLASGMELSGTVLNVVDFGAFVDIGLSDSALVHISRLADRFIRDPHEVVGVGDILTVWVVDVDKQRRRVSLTAIKPGSQRPQEQRRPKPAKQEGSRPPRAVASAATTGAGAVGTGAGNGGSGGSGGGGRARGGQDRGPRRGGPPRRDGGRPRVHQPPPKPKPMKPITKKMIDGKEPMRTFSDLLQFYQHKGDDGTPPPAAGQGS